MVTGVTLVAQATCVKCSPANRRHHNLLSWYAIHKSSTIKAPRVTTEPIGQFGVLLKREFETKLSITHNFYWWTTIDVIKGSNDVHRLST